MKAWFCMQLEDLVQEWLAKAMRIVDQRDICRRLTRFPVEIIGFRAQQGMEKCLKVVIVSRGHEPPRTHNLGSVPEQTGMNATALVQRKPAHTALLFRSDPAFTSDSRFAIAPVFRLQLTHSLP